MSPERSAVLEVLRAGPSYGLEIIERVKVHTGGKIALHQGSVYPLLRDLEGEGFLESYEGDPLPERGGRPRRYYRLAEDGRPPVPEATFGSLGEALLKSMRASGFNQAALAAAVTAMGGPAVEQGNVSRWVNHHMLPTLDTLARLVCAMRRPLAFTHEGVGVVVGTEFVTAPAPASEERLTELGADGFERTGREAPGREDFDRLGRQLGHIPEAMEVGAFVLGWLERAAVGSPEINANPFATGNWHWSDVARARDIADAGDRQGDGDSQLVGVEPEDVARFARAFLADLGDAEVAAPPDGVCPGWPASMS